MSTKGGVVLGDRGPAVGMNYLHELIQCQGILIGLLPRGSTGGRVVIELSGIAPYDALAGRNGVIWNYWRVCIPRVVDEVQI